MKDPASSEEGRLTGLDDVQDARQALDMVTLDHVSDQLPGSTEVLQELLWYVSRP